MARPPATSPSRTAGAPSGKRLLRACRAKAVTVRLDRFLFFIRLLKSRTLAQALIEQGSIRIDGKRVTKTSEDVHVGSVISLPLHGEVRVLRVLAMPARRGPASEARTCYEEVGEASNSANVSQQGRAD